MNIRCISEQNEVAGSASGGETMMDVEASSRFSDQYKQLGGCAPMGRPKAECLLADRGCDADCYRGA